MRDLCSSLAKPLVALLLIAAATAAEPPVDASRYFEIQIVDAQTKRGIPLVELVTTDEVRYVTDNAGRVAYYEPGHAGQTIYFSLHAPGYRVPKDGFGFAGVRLVIAPGERKMIELERANVAERLYRCTGEGLYRDTVLLGQKAPLKQPLGAGLVAGQDSVACVRYREKLHWFWGDTLRLSYPLGHFRMAGAVSDLPEQGGLDPGVGVDFDYFTAADGFSRPMAELPAKEGVIWLDGFCVAPDESGQDALLAHFSRRPGLEKPYEHGIMRYNDSRHVFERVTNVPLDDAWRFVRDQPIVIEEQGEQYLAFGNPFPVTRVKRAVADVLDPGSYESWSCCDASADPDSAKPRRDASGKLDWRWQKGPPVTQAIEERWLKAGLIKPDEARFLPVDSQQPGRRVLLHAGTTRWNPYVKRWITIANQIAYDKKSPSFLGEVWYCEADGPQGRRDTAVRVVTHDKQSFYNPCHHAFFDQQGGRLIHFEGTYANTFTSSPATPRYNYNQIMYRLDLDQPDLKQAFAR